MYSLATLVPFPERPELMANPLVQWLHGFVGSGEAEAASPALEGQLAALERDVERAVEGYRGTPLNRAGDLCIKAGVRDRALGYYGRAIDAFLEDEQLESARGVALKIVRLHPGAVRTLCTLTWLDLASGHSADALTHLEHYVEAVLQGGQREIAVAQLRKMGATTVAPKVREAVADALERLDQPEAAAEVRERGGEESDPEEIRQRCFEAAVQSGRR